MYMILSRDKKKFTKWAETDSDFKLMELVKYFAGNCICDDFVIYDSSQNKACEFKAFCNFHGITMKYGKDVKKDGQ